MSFTNETSARATVTWPPATVDDSLPARQDNRAVAVHKRLRRKAGSENLSNSAAGLNEARAVRARDKSLTSLSPGNHSACLEPFTTHDPSAIDQTDVRQDASLSPNVGNLAHRNFSLPNSSDLPLHVAPRIQDHLNSARAHTSTPSWPLHLHERAHAPAAIGTLSASIIPSSNFPESPSLAQPVSLASPAESAAQQSHALSKPKKFTYHTRGVSFEFVNPRESLRLERIEGRSASFKHSTRSRIGSYKRRSKSDLSRASHAFHAKSLGIVFDMTRKYSTPPRPLFDDLDTAYASILSRSARTNNISVSSRPQADPSTLGVTIKDAQKTFECPSPSPSVESSAESTPSRQSSLSKQRRMSHDWRSRLNDRFIANRCIESDPAVYGQGQRSKNEVRTQLSGAKGVRHSASEAEMSLETAEQNSHHRSFGSPVRYPLSGLFPKFAPDSPESKMRSMIEREESTAALVSAYQYSFSEEVLADQSNGRDTPTAHAIHYDNTQFDKGTPSANSTIGDILEDYHRPDDSCTVPEEFLDGSDTRCLTQSGLYSFETTSDATTSIDAQGRNYQDAGSSKASYRFQADQGIRAATVQALKGASSAVPSFALPTNPFKQSGDRPARSRQPADSTGMDSTSQVSSYGDTSKLLRGENVSPTPEAVRGVGSSKAALQKDLFASSESLFPPILRQEPSSSSSLHPSSAHAAISSGRDEVDGMTASAIRHISGLSGVSGLSGSIYVLRASFEHVDDVEQELRDIQDQTGDPAERSSGGINYIPHVAAFSPKAVRPGLKRLSSSEFFDLRPNSLAPSEISMESVSSSSHFELAHDQEESEDDGKNQDWETIPETRDTRNTFMTGSSWEDCSSLGSGQNVTSANFTINSDRRRSGSLHSRAVNQNLSSRLQSMTVSTIDPHPGLYQYQHPLPLSTTHENPFTSSPPPLRPHGKDKVLPTLAPAGSPRPTERDQSAESVQENSPYQWHRPNLSIVYEAVTDGSGIGTSNGQQSANVGMIHRLSSGHDIRSYTSSAVLGSEPGPEVSSEAVNGSPCDLMATLGDHHPYRLSATSKSLVARLRQDDPRMASSPLSDSNSFAQFTNLGTRFNLTGTPNGTGMREVGSSIVGSSSPLVLLSSSPPCVTMPAELAFEAKDFAFSSDQGTEFAELPASPLGNRDKIKKTNEGYLAVALDSPAQHQKPGHARGRSSVAGQKELRTLTLAQESPNSPISAPKQAALQRGPYNIPPGCCDCEAHLALAKYDIKDYVLKPRHRSPSSRNSATKSRKRTLSWIVFVMCLLFPPLLVVYGLGYLDAGVAYATGDRVRHFGSRSKRIAKWTGSIATVAIVGAIIIFWIVVSTVPNHLP